MSVRQSLLAILDQGPCYGYQLRNEFDRRTGSTWPLNVGQIYNTLERLERDGLVARGDADEHGHVYWQITTAGSEAASDWLHTASSREPAPRDELAIKLALAITLPGADAAASVAAERAALVAHIAELRTTTGSDFLTDASEITRSLITEARALRAEAELRWLDLVAERLEREPTQMRVLPLITERPPRGRPIRPARYIGVENSDDPKPETVGS